MHTLNMSLNNEVHCGHRTAYILDIELAYADVNLGRWAELLEYGIAHPPFKRYPLLWMIRACSHIHDWSVSTPLHGHMIYVVFHVHYFCLYVGRSQGPLIPRLRKHWIRERSRSGDSPFYNLLCTTSIHHWTIAPLHWTPCCVTACFLERAWSFK